MFKVNYCKLKGAIAEKGLNQKDFAALVGISESHFCQKLAGKYAFDQSEISKMCSVLDIKSSEIGDYFFTERVAF